MARHSLVPQKVPKRGRRRNPLALSMGGMTLAIGLIVGGGVIVQSTVAPFAVSDSAEAHTGDLAVTAQCLTDTGLYQLTYTLTLANVPSGQTAKVESHTGTTSFQSGWNRSSWSDWTTRATNVPSTQKTVSWTTTIPGTTTGNGPWEYVNTKWSPDGFTVKSDTRAEGLKGNCRTATNPSVTLDGNAVCATNGTWSVDWTVTITNSGSLSEVDLKVIKHLPAGSLINGVDAQVWLTEWIEHHANHGLPPWPTNGVVTFTQSNIPGSATSATAGVQYDFKGGPSGDPEKTITLSGDCKVPDSPTASASINTTPASCDAAGSAMVTGLAHATLVGTLDLTPGTHEATFKADDKYTFPNGSKTLTVTYTIPAKNTGIECEPQLPAYASLTSSYVCDAAYNTAELVGDRGANIAYLIDGQRISQANVPYAPFSLEALLDGHGVTVQYGHQYTVTVVVADVDDHWPSQQNEEGDVVLGTFSITLTEPFTCPVTFTPAVTVVDGTCSAQGSLSGVASPNVIWGKPYGDVTATYIDAAPSAGHITLTKTTFGPYDLSADPDACIEISVLPSLTVAPPTCTADGSLSTPQNGEGYTFTGWKNSKAPHGAGTYTAVYTANADSRFPNGALTYEVTKTVKGKLTGASCDTLAYTGAAGVGTLVAVGLLAITAGLGAIIWRRRRAA